jgi:hypothetical protein
LVFITSCITLAEANTETMTHTKDFSKKTQKQLNDKHITIIGTQAIPGFEGDSFFSGVAYMLEYNGKGFMRTHSQVIVLAQSSWNPDTDLN